MQEKATKRDGETRITNTRKKMCSQLMREYNSLKRISTTGQTDTSILIKCTTRFPAQRIKGHTLSITFPH